ncbi:MFS sugar transporter-like protein [Xylariales sp. PMI_506]|nr:MFS sugar transporter-like protein [Xylariales sp. PMI_506]
MFEFKLYVPRNSKLLNWLLIIASCVFATTTGYDGAIMTGFNIIPAYSTYFHTNTLQKSVLTAMSFVGAIIACFIAPSVCNKLGRKNAIIIACCIKLVGVILMAAANGYGAFLAGRIILGVGSGFSGCATPTWLSETIPTKLRGRGLSLIFAIYYAGALVAAGVTYGTSQLIGNIGWRLPSALQAVWSVLTLIILSLTPESPRWLAYNGDLDGAREVIALTHANGDTSDPAVLEQYKAIMDGIKWERECGETQGVIDMVRTAGNRYRCLLVLSVAVFTTCTGNSVITYFLGSILNAAGITNTHVQLEINIALSAWNLICALAGSQVCDLLGRRTMAMISCSSAVILMFLIGGLTKPNTSGIYATVAMIFLFQGSYSFGFTNLTLLYPPEVMNYSLRANGTALFTASNFALTIFTIFAFPLALAAIGYKFYFIIGCWDILEFLFIYFMWVETKGKTLEELDGLFGEEKPENFTSDVVLSLDKEKESI